MHKRIYSQMLSEGGEEGVAKPPKKANLCPCHAKCAKDIQRSI
jgi:hypothetical protein